MYLKTFLQWVIKKIPVAIFCLVISCINKYEEEAVGLYESQEQISSQGKNLSTHDSISLQLNKDKSCTLRYKKKRFQGKWKVYDNGDHTVIEVFDESNPSNPIVEGYAGNGLIRLWSHSAFLLSEYNEVLFKKKKQVN